MAISGTTDSLYQGLNQQQREATCSANGPLLIVAGAGTGKTRTLAHRVAHSIEAGTDPGRILLLTFTRRASGEMLRRVDGLMRRIRQKAGRRKAAGFVNKIWGGTFHATAARLLRIYGKSIGLEPSFTIHDRTDSADLLDVVRTEQGLSKQKSRFPTKATCLAIYSHVVNSQRPIEEVLTAHFPWCEEHGTKLKKLIEGYVDRKDDAGVLDYDDLLLFWHGLMLEEKAGRKIRDRFDAVFVDEFQDTNRLQGEIVKLLRPGGQGLTVVGDDAQSIYSFRAATVRNILDFPMEFPGTTIVTLQQNYRSTQPILQATNAVIAQSRERYTKDLWSAREAGEKPWLVASEDEDEQAEFIVRKVLEHRESGIDLRHQAVLFRASHHSIVLEAELARHNIPFVKYGGLKFTEAAHVKDLFAFVRLAENPQDVVAGSRALMLLPGIGPQKSRHLMKTLVQAAGDFAVWKDVRVPKASETLWPRLIQLMQHLVQAEQEKVAAQLNAVRKFYAPLLEEKYDNAEPRLRDLDQLEQLAGRFADRRTMLAEMALDPPDSTGDLAGVPELDEDYLILSTIHSAKGLEWDTVFVIHAADGHIPSDMATGSPEQIEEERRLFYVALTRAKHWLYVCHPLRYFYPFRGHRADQHGYAQLTRFLPESVLEHFQRHTANVLASEVDEEWDDTPAATKRKNIRRRVRSMWT